MVLHCGNGIIYYREDKRADFGAFPPAALQEQMPTLHYFQQGGEWEQLRLNALAQRFRLTLTSIGSNQHPFGSTVLPESRRTPARMRALAPFIDSLWALEPLLLQPLEYESK